MIYKQGDLFTAPELILVHGCNSQGVMGSGVAKLVKEKYPVAFNDYVDQHRCGGLQLGFNVYSRAANGKIIVNAITQNRYGNDGSRYVSYDAIDGCFRRLKSWMVTGGYQNERIALPKIGAGLGGGNWEVIAAIIDQYFINAVVYEL